MILVSVVGALVACIFLVPTLSDLISIARLVFGQATPAKRGAPADLPRLLFLVPAHNEEALIASCVESLRSQRYPTDRFAIHVIADNCRDRTADVARGAGAECIERNDPTRPGKPYAIVWAFGRLAISDFDAVVIVDADTAVDLEFARELAAAAPLRTKVVQGHFDVRNRRDNALTRMAAVLSAANHRFAFGLKTRVGINVPLSQGFLLIGTQVLAVHSWNAFSIAEDVELYVRLTEQGVRIESAPKARIYSEEARSCSARAQPSVTGGPRAS